MNIYAKKIRDRNLTIYPLGYVDYPSNFSDIMHKKYGHIASVISIVGVDCEEEKSLINGKGEFIHWDDEGYPDIYVKDKLIDFKAMKRAIKMLEKECQYKFKLVKINYFDINKSKEEIENDKKYIKILEKQEMIDTKNDRKRFRF